MSLLRIAMLVGLGALTLGGCPKDPIFVEGNPRARLATSFGDIIIELEPNYAPRSVENFEQYVTDGFYDGTIFHRVEAGFVIQGGGYTADLALKDTRPPIVNESRNGLHNLRGTVGAARTSDADSATSQFYVNLADNLALDATLTTPGYTVFGRVVSGMDVVDQIGAVAVQAEGDLTHVPVNDVVVQSATLEPGTLSVPTSWQNYIAGYQYNILTGLRSIAVDVLGALISGR